MKINKVSDSGWYIEGAFDFAKEALNQINNWQNSENIDGSIKYQEAMIETLAMTNVNQVVENLSQLWFEDNKLNKDDFVSSGWIVFHKKQKSMGIEHHTDIVADKKPGLTVLLYYSTNFDGGEFVFSDNTEFKPKEGDAVLITGDHSHAVKSILSGERIVSLTSFFKKE